MKKIENIINNLEVALISEKTDSEFMKKKNELKKKYSYIKDVTEGTLEEQFNKVYNQLYYTDRLRYNIGFGGGKNKKSRKSNGKRKTYNY